MKKIILFTLFLVFSLIVVSAQDNQEKRDPVGKWKFEAPYAPEGYTSGIIEVGLAGKKYSASMMFAGSENKFNGERVQIENDTISFFVFIEDQNVAVKLKMENNTKMSGTAVYSEGVIPLSLIKAVDIIEEIKKQ